MLLHGPSGVGKSSLLAAGLAPRLAPEHGWLHLRRDPERGLLGTLEARLGPDLAPGWRALEAERPLVIAVDQLEEVFTRRRGDPTDELSLFADALMAMFAAKAPPKGRLLLSFRKEWAPELSTALAAIPHESVFLPPLDRRAIVEVVSGVRRHDSTRRRYRTRVDPGLPAAIATDLLDHPDAPVAPLLQVLLARMWAEAPFEAGERVLGHTAYRRMVEEGLHLGAFLDRQLTALRDTHPDAVDSGLALAVLAAHVTRGQTAGTVPAATLEAEYGDVGPLAERLVALHLLVAPTTDATRLAHDTLAPEVSARFDASDAPGQRARRIIDARAPGQPFDDIDLAVVLAGEPGMRRWTPGERALVAASRAASVRRKLTLWLAVIAILALLASLGFSALESARQKRDARRAAAAHESLKKRVEAARHFDLGQRDIAVHHDVIRALAAFREAIQAAPDEDPQRPVYVGRQLWTAARAPVLDVVSNQRSGGTWARSPVTGARLPVEEAATASDTPVPALDRGHRRLAYFDRSRGVRVVDLPEGKTVFSVPIPQLEGSSGDLSRTDRPRLALVAQGAVVVATAGVDGKRHLWARGQREAAVTHLESLDVPGALTLARAGQRTLTVVAEPTSVRVVDPLGGATVRHSDIARAGIAPDAPIFPPSAVHLDARARWLIIVERRIGGGLYAARAVSLGAAHTDSGAIALRRAPFAVTEVAEIDGELLVLSRDEVGRTRLHTPKLREGRALPTGLPVFTYDPRYVAILQEEGAYALYEIARGLVVHRTRPPEPAVSARFSDDRRLLWTQDDDGRLLAWPLVPGPLDPGVAAPRPAGPGWPTGPMVAGDVDDTVIRELTRRPRAIDLFAAGTLRYVRRGAGAPVEVWETTTRLPFAGPFAAEPAGIDEGGAWRYTDGRLSVDLLLGGEGPCILPLPQQRSVEAPLATLDPAELLAHAYATNRAAIADRDPEDRWLAWAARSLPAFAWGRATPPR